MTCLEVVAITADDGGMRHLQMEAGASGWRHKNQAEARLATLRQRMQGSGGNRSEGDEFVDFAAKGNFDLIVMAADGCPWWQHAFFGGIANVVHPEATVPTWFVSDGSRREKVASKQIPPTLNPLYYSFATADVG
jgi:nucleotide-binding universal stress UspA family protein